MSICTFWGHRECPESIYPTLQAAIKQLINEYDVDMFYVGNQGQFDRMVRRALRELKRSNPAINYAVVLAYMPTSASKEDHSDTMLPEGIEVVHPRYAISRRNDWMLHQSDFVITYITHSWGGAARYAQKAIQQKKVVINIGEKDLKLPL